MFWIIEIWKAYDRWAERNPIEEAKVLQELEKFRQRYCEKYENRQIGLVFGYFYAVCRFSEFLEAEYGEGIAEGDIMKNIQALFEWKECSENVQLSYEINVWNEFIEDGGIHKVLVPGLSTCRLLAEAKCDEYSALYQCYQCDGIPLENYNPMELRLPDDPAAAILLEKPKLIQNFPRHIVCDSPVLMIRNNSLLEMLNTYLEIYSRKKRASVRRITPKKLTKEMFSHNLCLFEYVGVKHNTYTFRMKDVNNKDIRVIFIKLTEEQHEKLKAVAKDNYRREAYSVEEVQEMNRCLKYFCENVQSLVGEVGVPSMVLDMENE